MTNFNGGEDKQFKFLRSRFKVEEGVYGKGSKQGKENKEMPLCLPFTFTSLLPGKAFENRRGLVTTGFHTN